MLLAILSATTGCAINADVCADKYQTASRKDTADTQKEILEHNLFLQKMGCPQDSAKTSEPDLLARFRNVFH
jgi:hypothetical protein